MAFRRSPVRSRSGPPAFAHASLRRTVSFGSASQREGCRAEAPWREGGLQLPSGPQASARQVRRRRTIPPVIEQVPAQHATNSHQADHPIRGWGKSALSKCAHTIDTGKTSVPSGFRGSQNLPTRWTPRDIPRIFHNVFQVNLLPSNSHVRKQALRVCADEHGRGSLLLRWSDV